MAICRLEPSAPLPGWAALGGFCSITRTADELSIVCPQGHVPAGISSDRGWRALKVDGPLDLSLVGILAGLAKPLAEAGVNLFAVSTYDTDYVLVKDDRLDEAVRALSRAGWRVRQDA